MSTVKLLRDLWRLRLLVGVVAVLSILLGIVVAFQVSFPAHLESRRYDVGVADVRVLVDTPTSQVIDIAPKGSDTLGSRTSLLASLMVDGVVQDDIARRAGLQPDKLEGIAQTGGMGSAAGKEPDPRGYTLTTRVLSNDRGDLLPIIEVSAQAPDAAAAAKLANAAIAGLRAYLEQQAAAGEVPAKRQLRVSGLGTAQAGTITHGPSPAIAVVLGLFVFCLGCGVLAAASALARDWRAIAAEEAAEQAAAEELEPGGPRPVPDPPVAPRQATPRTLVTSQSPSAPAPARGAHFDWSSPPQG